MTITAYIKILSIYRILFNTASETCSISENDENDQKKKISIRERFENIDTRKVSPDLFSQFLKRGWKQDSKTCVFIKNSFKINLHA